MGHGERSVLNVERWTSMGVAVKNTKRQSSWQRAVELILSDYQRVAKGFSEMMLKSRIKINIETRRSTTPGKRVILVQGPC